MASAKGVHSFLQTALDAVPPAARPEDPPHRGEVKPELGRLGNTGVGIWLAELVQASVAKQERARFTGWLEAARMVYGRHARGEVTEGHKGAAWRTRSLSRPEMKAHQKSLELEPRTVCYTRTAEAVLALSPPLHVANAAALLAFDLEMGGGGPYANVAAKDAIKQTITVVPDRAAFVAELDRVLLREELRSLIWQRGDRRAGDVTECLWRAGAAGKTTHSLGRLANGEYILSFKVGARWKVFSGPRDEVLATVPDPHFECAVDAVRG